MHRWAKNDIVLHGSIMTYHNKLSANLNKNKEKNKKHWNYSLKLLQKLPSRAGLIIPKLTIWDVQIADTSNIIVNSIPIAVQRSSIGKRSMTPVVLLCARSSRLTLILIFFKQVRVLSAHPILDLHVARSTPISLLFNLQKGVSDQKARIFQFGAGVL